MGPSVTADGEGPPCPAVILRGRAPAVDLVWTGACGIPGCRRPRCVPADSAAPQRARVSCPVCALASVRPPCPAAHQLARAWLRSRAVGDALAERLDACAPAGGGGLDRRSQHVSSAAQPRGVPGPPDSTRSAWRPGHEEHQQGVAGRGRPPRPLR